MPLPKNSTGNAVIHLDTNILVRFFTNDDKEKARKARLLLEQEKEIVIADVVFPEIEYVLSRLYQAKREKITEAFTFLVSRPNIVCSAYVRNAVELYSRTNLDMADCIIAAHARGATLASFDEELLDVEGVNRYW